MKKKCIAYLTLFSFLITNITFAEEENSKGSVKYIGKAPSEAVQMIKSRKKQNIIMAFGIVAVTVIVLVLVGSHHHD